MPSNSPRAMLLAVLLLLLSHCLTVVMASPKFQRITSLTLEKVDGGKINLFRRDSDLDKQPPVEDSLADELLLQFEAFGKVFVVHLDKRPLLLPQHAKIHVYHPGNGHVEVEEALGAPYVGRKLAVTNKSDKDQALAHIFTKATLTSSSLPENSELDHDPFARFHIRKMPDGKLDIQGGFTYNDRFFKIQQSGHPTLRDYNMGAFSPESMKSKQATTQDLGLDMIITEESMLPSTKMPSALKSGGTTRNYRCGHDDKKFNTHPNGAASYYAKAMDKLASEPRLNARAERGCPANRKTLYIGIAADCSYMQKFQGDKAKVQANIVADFNVVSGIYEKFFNIDLGIISIVMMADCSTRSSDTAWNIPCSVKHGIDERLNSFSKWRGSQTKDAGIFHMVSGCSESEIVGIAWLNQVCQTTAYKSRDLQDTISGTSVSVLIPNQFAVIAHEIGHNFGAVHDCDAATCTSCSGPDCQCCMCDSCDCKGRFLMNPESGGLNVKAFSPCTQSDVCGKMPVIAHCLQEPGTMKAITGAVCGNGIREAGEECDCGGKEGCVNNPCCTADCKLKQGAVCSDGNDKCCKSCKLIPAANKFICRPGQSTCQKDAVCDGVHRDCPKSRNLADGSSCENGSGQCASGQCTSRDQQCSAIGSRLGLSKACKSTPSSCRMVCQASDGCVFLDANFIDGTTCGFNGFCKNGQCSEPALLGFIKKNLDIIIVIGVVLAVVLASMMIRNICVRVMRSRRSARYPIAPPISR